MGNMIVKKSSNHPCTEQEGGRDRPPFNSVSALKKKAVNTIKQGACISQGEGERSKKEEDGTHPWDSGGTGKRASRKTRKEVSL